MTDSDVVTLRQNFRILMEEGGSWGVFADEDGGKTVQLKTGLNLKEAEARLLEAALADAKAREGKA